MEAVGQAGQGRPSVRGTSGPQEEMGSPPAAPNLPANLSSSFSCIQSIPSWTASCIFAEAGGWRVGCVLDGHPLLWGQNLDLTESSRPSITSSLGSWGFICKVKKAGPRVPVVAQQKRI